MRRRRGLISAIGKLLSEGLGFESPQSSQTGGCLCDLSSTAATAASLCAGHSIARKWKSSTQPDGGEGLEKRKGCRREAGSEESVDQRCEPMNKNRVRGASVGRAGNTSQSPYSSKTRSVDSAVVH